MKAITCPFCDCPDTDHDLACTMAGIRLGKVPNVMSLHALDYEHLNEVEEELDDLGTPGAKLQFLVGYCLGTPGPTVYTFSKGQLGAKGLFEEHAAHHPCQRLPAPGCACRQCRCQGIIDTALLHDGLHYEVRRFAFMAGSGLITSAEAMERHARQVEETVDDIGPGFVDAMLAFLQGLPDEGGR